MKLIFYFIVMMMLAPFSLAAMQVSIDHTGYNIDDQIRVNLTVSENLTVKGFIRMQLSCANTSFPFYMLPVTIQQNKQQFIATELPVSQNLGLCSIDAALTNFNANILDSVSSSKFIITDELSPDLKLDKEVYKASESILITGNIYKQSGEQFTGKLDVFLDDLHATSFDATGSVEYNLQFAHDTKGGKHLLRLSAAGSNHLETGFPFFVESEVTKIIVDIKEKAYLPAETAIAAILLKDQAGETMPGQVSVDLVAPANNWLGTWKLDMNGLFQYKLGDMAAHGMYTLTATYGKLEETASFNVSQVKKLGFEAKENIVLIKNTGNIIYNDTVSLYLESSHQNYLISKKILLMPGEETSVELYKEVPDDNYTVSVGNKTENQSAAFTATVTVIDQRTLAEKGKDAVNGITGAVVAHGGISITAFLIVLIAFSSLIVYNYRTSKNQPKKSMQTLRKETRQKEVQTMMDDFNKK